ncbi:unnamed protein product, partial [marine sediment metagenome]
GEVMKSRLSILVYLKIRYLDAFLEKLSGRGKIVVSVSKSIAEEIERYYKFKTHQQEQAYEETSLLFLQKPELTFQHFSRDILFLHGE